MENNKNNEQKETVDEKRLDDEFEALFESVIFNYYLKLDNLLEESEVWEIAQLSSSLNKFVDAHLKIRRIRESNKED